MRQPCCGECMGAAMGCMRKDSIRFFDDVTKARAHIASPPIALGYEYESNFILVSPRAPWLSSETMISYGPAQGLYQQNYYLLSTHLSISMTMWRRSCHTDRSLAPGLSGSVSLIGIDRLNRLASCSTLITAVIYSSIYNPAMLLTARTKSYPDCTRSSSSTARSPFSARRAAPPTPLATLRSPSTDPNGSSNIRSRVLGRLQSLYGS